MISVLDLPTANKHKATFLKTNTQKETITTVNFYTTSKTLEGGLTGKVYKIQFDHNDGVVIKQNDLIDVEGKRYRVIAIIERNNPAFKPFIECEIKLSKDERISLI